MILQLEILARLLNSLARSFTSSASRVQKACHSKPRATSYPERHPASSTYQSTEIKYKARPQRGGEDSRTHFPLNSVKTKKMGDYGSPVCPKGGIQAGTAMPWKMSLLTMIWKDWLTSNHDMYCRLFASQTHHSHENQPTYHVHEEKVSMVTWTADSVRSI